MQNSVWFFLQVLLKSTAFLGTGMGFGGPLPQNLSALRHQILTVALVCLLCLAGFHHRIARLAHAAQRKALE